MPLQRRVAVEQVLLRTALPLPTSPTPPPSRTAEIKRWEDIKNPGSQAEPGSFLGFESSFKGTGISGYPGGPFNPFGLG